MERVWIIDVERLKELIKQVPYKTKVEFVCSSFLTVDDDEMMWNELGRTDGQKTLDQFFNEKVEERFNLDEEEFDDEQREFVVRNLQLLGISNLDIFTLVEGV